MNIGILLPGFSASDSDWALPVQANLVRTLAQTDDVRVLALRYPHHRQPYTAFGARVYPLGMGQVRGVRRLRLWVDALRRLRRLHDEQPFDVLHGMWADETGLITVWAGRWLNLPTVVSILGGELVGLRDIGYGLQLSAFSRWVVGQALTADRVIVPSEYIQRLIVQAGYVVPEQCLCTGVFGIDTQLFAPDDTPAHPYRLIHVASLVPVKDQATLLRALARLDTRVTLDIIGTGPEQVRLTLLAAELGVAGRVRFLGAVAYTDLPAYYRRAALHVLSSRHESLAMVTLEAAACGVPSVSTGVGLLPDAPALGVTVPVGDDAALAAAICGLLGNPARREALGQAARATVVERFSLERAVAELRALYQGM
ncbi:MAG: glycosyltransferase family 4 protein [Chloroflexi bacterium]|nr:glycosyltransferase family 4 protein [Chloroflexota bacterium]